MKINIDSLYNENALYVMASMDEASVDMILTDPPYRVQQKGGSGTMSGYWRNKETNAGKIFSYNDIDIEDYLPQLYRVLKDKGHCYIMCNNFNLRHFFDVIGLSPFHFTKLLVWDKRKAICGRFYMTQVEYIFFLRKGGEKQINFCGTSDLLSFPISKQKDECGNNLHDCEKPIALMQVLIENSTQKGEVVLDPFVGIGTTAIAAKNVGRHYIGMEIDKQYYDVAEKRLKEPIQQNLFY